MCNMMCLYSEWDENKPRDCANCSGNYSSAGAILLPQQIGRMAWQRIRNMEQKGTGTSKRTRPIRLYTKHKKVIQVGTRQVSLTGYRPHRG